jgi:type IV pilus assembly protein PilM
LTSPAASATLESKFFQIGIVRRIDRWLHAMPHPAVVVEIAPGHVAVARWSGTNLDGVVAESLPTGAVMPSPVENNVTQPDAARAALRRAFNHVSNRGAPVTLLVPDAVVRVFILPFENLPRRADDALPLLRWRLKKSVPFDVDETVVSWMRQSARDEGLEIVAAVARQRILREYEDLVESVGAPVAVVLSSTLAALPLLEERGATLLMRLSGKTLSTVVVNGANLCVYRSTDLPAEAGQVEPRAVLDEVFPAIAYYQDNWNAPVDRARLSGFGDREEVFRGALAAELDLHTGSMADMESVYGLSDPVRDLIRHGLDSLAGWMMNAGS